MGAADGEEGEKQRITKIYVTFALLKYIDTFKEV
jgi:hypothetical protein